MESKREAGSSLTSMRESMGRGARSEQTGMRCSAFKEGSIGKYE